MESKIRQWLDTILAEEAFKDCFLLEVVIKPPKKFEVYLDADEGITLGRCQKISRQLEAFLDNDAETPENYLLEVSSGGVDRPLTLKRQYPKHIGRKIRIELGDKTLEGRLKEIQEEVLIIEHVKSKKGKKKTIEVREVPFDDIISSKILISFK